VILLVWLGGLSEPSLADSKVIRLRNEVITTAPPEQGKTALHIAATDTPVTGLFLVQFTDHLQVAWRDELRAHGVELIRFVPDDAFVARFRQARLGEIRALPFVRWTGEYRPELKVFSALHGYLKGNSPTNGVAVSVLLTPGATLADAAQGGPALKSMKIQSRSSMGTVFRAQVSSADLAALARSDAVLWIEPAPRMKLSDEISSKIVAGGEVP
jgi:hypothetical protein